MRVITIGDIHGELGHLKNLLEKIDPQENDRFIFLGDYIDRGEDSPGVVEFLLNFTPDCIFLRGNHEQMLLDSVDNSSIDDAIMWLNNGGERTQSQYELAPEGMWEKHLEFFRATELTHKEEIDGVMFYFSHAGWSPYNDLEEQYNNVSENIVLWERAHTVYPKTAITNWTDGTAVFGHTPLEKPFVYPPILGIDTGAVFGRVLTAAILGQEIKILQSDPS